MSNGKMLRVGLAGLGFGGAVHLPLLQAIPELELCGVCSGNLDKAFKLGNQYGARVFGNWREMIEHDTIDAVVMVVPPVVQDELAMATSHLGKDFFCEKPLSTTLKQAELITARALSNQLVCGIDFIFPELEVWSQFRNLLRVLPLGAIRHFSYTWQVETYACRYKKQDSWKSNANLGGGAWFNFGSHAIYNVTWLFESEMRDCVGVERGTGGLSHTCVDASLFLNNGINGSLHISCDTVNGCGHKLEVWCEEGVLSLINPTSDYVRGFEIQLIDRSGEKNIIQSSECFPGKDGREVPVRHLLQRWVNAVVNRTAIAPSIEEGLQVQRVLEKLRVSR